MAIPKFTKDVEVIQKLSDLPNATEGLTANELKAKFDEAAKLVKAFLNDQLIPAIAAKEIPFDKTAAIDAENIQNAIIEVQKQVRDAASGTIVNGSVTKEKLSAELLARVYGGRPWVSMKTPDSKDNVAEDFPIGQVWFRPAFDVVNARTTNWTGNGCTVAAEEQKVTLTGDNTVATASMTQSLTGIGQEDDLVYILFDVTEQDAEITDVSVSINGDAPLAIMDYCAARLLPDGALSLKFNATWPSTSLAGGNLVVENLVIVNVDQIVRQLTEGQAIPDWAVYLRNLLPLESYHSPAEVYIQMTDGNWWPMGFEVLPVSRGGTGLNSVEKDHFLVGGDNGEMRQAGVEDVVSLLGSLRIATGTYTGTGSNRTIDLGITPKLIHLFSHSGPTDDGNHSTRKNSDQPVTLGNGATASEMYQYTHEDSAIYYYPMVKLSGSQLIFTGASHNKSLGNHLDVTYTWIAIY